MTPLPPIPRLLVVEDDAVSRLFLSEALSGLPAEIDAVATIAAARGLAERQVYALCLIDAHLPDGDGAHCLSALRQVQTGIPALAITAEAFRDESDRLCAAGFIQVLQKPITVAALQTVVRRTLGEDAASMATESAHEQLPVWDQACALAAVGGRAETVSALRLLFLTELPLQRQDILAAHGRKDAGGVRAVLHKLKASCGFVGATRLLTTVQAFSEAPLDPAKLQLFEAAVSEQLDTT